MSMRQEIETWVAALAHYDANEFEEAIEAFQPIVDTSKILFNCGVIRATLGEHESAVECYQRAVKYDQYLAIAYFQQGVSNFLLGDFEEALANFNDTLLYLRGNRYIDYEQLGLKFKLYACEALFDRGLCYIYLQQMEAGMTDLAFASKEKAVPEHDVIDEAIREKAEGYTVFSIPVGLVFRPSEAKIKNVQTRQYLGAPRVVAQQDINTHHHRRNISADQWARDDRPAEKISYAATNLVKPGLSSRVRQQSEPPIYRNQFPPTPPPENEKPLPLRSSQSTSSQRRASPDRIPGETRSRSLNRRAPEPLDLGVAAFDRPRAAAAPQEQQQPRRGTQRSASEQPYGRRGHDQYNDRRSQYSDSGHQSRYRPERERLFGAVEHEGQQDQVAAQLHQQQQQQEQQQRARASSRISANPLSARSNRPELIEEQVEEEEVQDDYFRARLTGTSVGTTYELRDDEATPRKYGLRSPRSRHYSNNNNKSSSSRSQKVRFKVHFGEDTRYIILPTTAIFKEFVDHIVRKFTLRGSLIIKMKDEEGDMITMADQEDLDMALTMSLEVAAREKSEMAKVEVWVQESR